MTMSSKYRMNLFLDYQKNKNRYDFDRINLMRSKSEEFLNNSSGNSELTPEQKPQGNSAHSASENNQINDISNKNRAHKGQIHGTGEIAIDDEIQRISQMEDLGSSQHDRDFRKYVLGEISEIQDCPDDSLDDINDNLNHDPRDHQPQTLKIHTRHANSTLFDSETMGGASAVAEGLHLNTPVNTIAHERFL